jgi:hypothetical protein
MRPNSNPRLYEANALNCEEDRVAHIWRGIIAPDVGGHEPNPQCPIHFALSAKWVGNHEPKNFHPRGIPNFSWSSSTSSPRPGT